MRGWNGGGRATRIRHTACGELPPAAEFQEILHAVRGESDCQEVAGKIDSIRRVAETRQAGRPPSSHSGATSVLPEISFFHPLCACVVCMKAMQIEYPESWTASAGSSPERFENEARMALAMKLFEMGRLTSGQAAQLAGVSRIAFLFNCPQWNVPAVNWDADELAAEFKPIHS
jgi:predicted HTH domain antitoxin